MLENLIIAIQNRLANDAGLNAVVPADRIGNHVKDDEVFPHIDWRLDGVEVKKDKDKDAEGYEGNLVLEVFSAYRGDLECYQIQALIYSALATRLTVTDANNYLFRFGTIDVTTDADNRTRQATITYPFMIGEL